MKEPARRGLQVVFRDSAKLDPDTDSDTDPDYFTASDRSPVGSQPVSKLAALGTSTAARRAGPAGPLLALQTSGLSHTVGGQEEVPPGAPDRRRAGSLAGYLGPPAGFVADAYAWYNRMSPGRMHGRGKCGCDVRP